MTPDFRAYVRRHLPPLAIRPEREVEIVDELALQLEAAYDAALREGASADEAWARVRAEIPDWDGLAATVTSIETPGREARHVAPEAPSRRPAFGGLFNDIRHAAREPARATIYSAAAIGTLALALGLGAAAFALIDGILIRPLAYRDAARLVLITATVPPEGRSTVELTLPDVGDLAASHIFDAVAAVLPFAGTTTTDPPSQIEGLEVSPAFFDLLGVTLPVGRTFSSDDASPGRPPVAIISHAHWQRLGAPADVIGRTIAINEVPRTIIGVAPRGLSLELLPDGEVFLPITSQHPLGSNRGLRAARGVARMRLDASRDGANSALAIVGERLAAAYPDTNRGRSFAVEPLQDVIVGPIRAQLWLVASLVGLVLLVASVNFAGLLMARTVGRLREVAVRMALGAGRWRLARESIVEGLLVTLSGATLGALLGSAALRALQAVPGLALPRLAEAAIDVRTFVALTIAALVIAGFSGLAPVVVLRRITATASLRTGHETTGRPALRARTALIVGQTAFAFLLLVATVLLAMSLRSLLAQPLGFETNDVVTLRIAVPFTRYGTREETSQFFSTLLDEIRAHPAVRNAGLTSNLPLAGSVGSTLSVQGRDDVAIALRPTVGWNWVSPGYFAALGMPIVRGRDFTDSDRTRPSHVTVINETLATLHFPSEDPIGRRVYFGGFGPGGPAEWHEIIGVVGDVRHRQLDAPPDARAYDLFGQHWGRTASLAVRTTDAPLQVAGFVRQIVAARDPQLAVFAVQTTADLVRRATAMRRLLLWLVTLFAGIGLAVALVGLYGTLSYIVAQRTREMGVRIALGASPASIRTLVLARGLAMAAMGIAIGLTGLMALRRVIEGQLAGLSALHGPALAAAILAMLAAAMAACVVPAARAMRVNPVEALRSE